MACIPTIGVHTNLGEYSAFRGSVRLPRSESAITLNLRQWRWQNFANNTRTASRLLSDVAGIVTDLVLMLVHPLYGSVFSRWLAVRSWNVLVRVRIACVLNGVEDRKQKKHVPNAGVR